MRYTQTMLTILTISCLAMPAQAGDEQYRNLAHGLGMIGEILEEKRRADSEGREVQLDTQGMANSIREHNRAQDELVGRRTYSDGQSYGERPLSPPATDIRRYGAPNYGQSTYPRAGTAQDQPNGYASSDRQSKQITRHQRMLEAIADQNKMLLGRDETTAPERNSYRAPASPTGYRTPATAKQAQPAVPAPYPSTEQPTGGRPATPNTQGPRCVKWGKPTADFGGGVFGTGQAENCLKYEF